MPNIQINIKNKVARADRAIIVCDNSDYTAVFDFDAEWDEYTTKTARFVYGGRYTDVVFSGNECAVPVIQDTRAVTVGVYAGDLHTTTPAYFACVPSILCCNGIPADPTPDVYNQIMELLNKDSGVWYPAVDDAGNMSWTRSMSETEPQPVNIKGQKGDAGANGADGKDGISPAVSVAAITGGNRITITDAEGAKTFDVMDGAQGASGADGKDYVLTDADKQEIAETAAGLVDVPSVQPDWNQNDSTQPDYVKNRPFYTGNPVETVLVEESTVSFSENQGLYMAEFPSTFEATVGETYKVSWDSAAYECTCVDFENAPVIGNLSIIGAGSDTGEPFIMGILNGEGIRIFTADTSASHTVSISESVAPITKIDEKYIPDSLISYINDVQNAANSAKSTANSAQSTANSAQSTANSAQSTANSAQSTANSAQSKAESAMASALWGGAETYRPVQTSVDITVPGISTDLNGYHLIPGERYTAGNVTSVWDGSKISWFIHGIGESVEIVRDVTGTRYKVSSQSIASLTISGKFMPAISRTKYITKAKMLPPYVVFPKLTFMPTDNGSTKFITMAVDDNGNISTTDESGLHNKFATEAYVDGRIQENAAFIKSSTPGSTKKFKITVNDSGTITATEVT